MGYNSLVSRNVDKAFKLIGDLANTVTLVRKATSTFNFSTLNIKETDQANLVTTAIISDIKKPSGEHNTKASSLMLKTKEIGDINLFDTVIINNESFKIGPLISTDGFVTTVEIFREG